MARLFAIAPFRMVLAVCLGVDIVIAMGFGLLFGSGDESEPGLVWGVSVGIPLAVLVIVIPLVTVLMRPWRYVRDMDAMLAGGAWVHWAYDEPAWETANRVEQGRLRRTAFTGALFAVGLGLLVLVIGLAVGDATLVFTGGVVAGGSLVATAAFGATSPALLARRSKRGEVYISALGIYRRPGGYTPVFGFGYALKDVALFDDPAPHVHFEALVQGRVGARPESLADVAVPPGREDEARSLVARLRGEVLGLV